ncbi:energy-coupling factor transporter transmembrane protein EcfT, partial [Pseudonocardia pini]|uniref:energy-coupling factor transporter transmembrane protein EcfT n=1 Tax=Pseudonocardia pini TaxID=2758030 RepID=UPI0015F09719
MNPLGLYAPGDSLVHRLSAGPKLLVLLVFVTLVVVRRDVSWLAGACTLAALGYVVAHPPWRRVWQVLRMLLVLAVFVGALQLWLVGPQAALVTVLGLVAALAAANLFTLTTRIDAVVAAVERGLGPLRRVGVRPDRLGLL